EEVGEYLEKGVSLDEASRAKRFLRAEAVYARDSIRAGAQVLGAALAAGLGVEDVESWPQRIGAVTVDEINAALGMVITRDRSVTALLLPEKADDDGRKIHLAK
ncbi:MAG: peptidase M16, partial [Magnetovibrio sp.]|nr:peptidase M16 [Magnetovibrio sp.]